MNYEKLALVTKSDQFHGDLVPRIDLLQSLGAAIAAINALDAIKKSLFYGRPYPLTHGVAESCNSTASGWIVKSPEDGPDEWRRFSEAKAIDVIHALIGKATEAGEGLELLLSTLKTKVFDEVNAIEETFDGQWYDAILCDAVGITFAQGQANNIAKLQARFGDKFRAFEANNRDLFAEREVLETVRTNASQSG